MLNISERPIIKANISGCISPRKRRIPDVPAAHTNITANIDNTGYFPAFSMNTMKRELAQIPITKPVDAPYNPELRYIPPPRYVPMTAMIIPDIAPMTADAAIVLIISIFTLISVFPDIL